MMVCTVSITFKDQVRLEVTGCATILNCYTQYSITQYCQVYVRYCRYCSVSCMYCQVLLSVIMVNIFVGCSTVSSDIVGIIKYRQVSLRLKKHFDDPVPHGNFPVLYCLSIGSPESSFGYDQIGECMSRIQLMPNLR